MSKLNLGDAEQYVLKIVAKVSNAPANISMPSSSGQTAKEHSMLCIACNELY